MKMIQKGNTPNTPIETWICDTLEEVNEIPNNAPTGSIALVLTNNGLVVKMKNGNNEWKDL